ncbi:DUF7824 domain-containing protein [Virgisporangium aurantiacum]|uniref:DUF7824 domain-containing protein n=1 Tax=Virgisporangium aurantiacum TaxID=175570 RepID=A0A8J3Z679_9ACTN|nr:DUF6493 family protein [Virgisporangium aurantiacum]GIJ58219.1 hypothetical protein Vau01_057350 [Virgisporangium aurantiacum]
MADLAALVRTGPPGAVAAAVSGLDPAGRRAVAAALPGLVRELTRDWWYSGCEASLAVAAVGCMPTAAKAAALLARRTIQIRGDAVAPAVAVAGHHGVGWLADLAYRLAARAPGTTVEFVAGLIAHENAPPPRDDDFALAWLRGMIFGDRETPLVDRLRTDPFLDALLPRMFEVDRLGADFNAGTNVYRTGAGLVRVDLPQALAALAAEGRLDRDLLLDGCVARLLRGGKPADLTGYVALHDRLEPTAAEATARTADYLRLLADGPNAAAVMAQKRLRATGAAEVDAVLDASRAVLARPEKPLARTQLIWLDRLAREHPARAAEIAAVAAVAADHPAVEVRDRAAALVAKHAGPAVAVVAPVAVLSGDALQPASGPAPVPPPIVDPDELAEEIAPFVRSIYDRDGGPAAMTLERILDGCVRLAGDRLGAAFGPVLVRHRLRLEAGPYADSCVADLLGDALHAASGVPRPVDDPVRTAIGFVRRPARDREPAPQRMIIERLAETAKRVRPGGPPLLATPTHANGSVDPAALLDRLAASAGTGREPWPTDLAQALLRLPAGVDEATARAAERLRTPAGDRTAAWLRAGGLPTPESRTVEVTRRAEGRFPGDIDWMPERRIAVATGPPPGYDDPTGLLTRPTSDTGEYLPLWSKLWPAVLPGYRELVAAWMLPSIAGGAQFRQRPHETGPVLVDIAACTGAGGPALALALAYGLAAKHVTDRVAAVDALLALAGAGDLDAPATGRWIGVLAAAGMLTASRIERPLRDAAAAGAPATTWRLLAAALPPILALPKPPPGAPDLLTLAAETAAATGLPIEVPGLAEVAALGTKTRLVTEARRLDRARKPGA